ncbi:hypothetical protein [Streptomyces sp. NRRL S-337]|nr:hypothetical protein [Streptomyces sp. NRRL S-337]
MELLDGCRAHDQPRAILSTAGSQQRLSGSCAVGDGSKSKGDGTW